MRNTSFILLLLLSPFHFFGQCSNPEKGIVYADTIVPRVDIFINPDTLNWLYENVESNQEFHATFVFSNGLDADTVNNIGFRLRGNTSRVSAKKSFKVSFNTFEQGRKWHGLQKLNLNGEHNDPSIIRSKLCWDLLIDFNLPAARSNHVELYINNNFYGLYLNIEHIDEVFIKSRFDNDNGNFYKCLWPADLDYLGSNPDNYKLDMGDRRVYELKTNTQEDDYSDIAHFIDVLNNTSNADFACELEKVFNVQDYLKIIAVDIFTGNWDGYIYNKNNFYLYHNTVTGKFEYINYDLDNTFGIDWFDRDWGTRNIYDWEKHGNEQRLLYTRIMANQELRDQFSFYFYQLLNDVINHDDYINRINYFKNRNASYVTNDPYYPLDYGFTLDDYYASFVEPLGMHVKYGIIEYFEIRRSSASSQLENNEIAPIIKNIKNSFAQPGEDIWVTASVSSNNLINEVEISYSRNGATFEQSPMFDDGNHNDDLVGDNIFGGSIPNIELNTTILYQIQAIDDQSNSSLKPCEPVEFILTTSTQAKLYINEFMAGNTTTIADEFGEFDDWLEVYNGDSESIGLGDKFLSDNFSIPNKWQLPDVMLQPGDFLLIWADDDINQGANHTNFKLSAAGEEIGLFDSENTGFIVLDSVSYGAQTTDISRGRSEDASAVWKFFNFPTPGYSNLFGAINDPEANLNKPIFFPNPVTNGQINFRNQQSGKLYSYTGELKLKFKEVINLSVAQLPSGIYLMITDKNQCYKIVIP